MTEWWEGRSPWKDFPIEQSRFWQKMVIRGPEDCWEWKAARDKDGYGRFRHMHKIYQANIYAYLITKGPIAKGDVVLHSCDNPPCCNPNHLSSGTHLDNMLDMVAKNRENNGILPRLADEDILFCRQQFWYGGKLASELADFYKIPIPTMDSLVLGRSWAKIHPFCGEPATFHHLRGHESIPFCEKHKDTMGKFFTLKRNGARCRHVEE